MIQSNGGPRPKAAGALMAQNQRTPPPQNGGGPGDPKATEATAPKRRGLDDPKTTEAPTRMRGGGGSLSEGGPRPEAAALMTSK